MDKDDFFPGMKVCLNGEFGAVIDDFTPWDGIYFVDGIEYKNSPSKLYGLIRWDSKKQLDMEDWKGLFGSFKNSGGFEVSADYQFKFINDDGTLK